MPTTKVHIRMLLNSNFCVASYHLVVFLSVYFTTLIDKNFQLRPSEQTVKSQNEVHYMLCGSLHTICMDHEEVCYHV